LYFSHPPLYFKANRQFVHINRELAITPAVIYFEIGNLDALSATKYINGTTLYRFNQIFGRQYD